MKKQTPEEIANFFKAKKISCKQCHAVVGIPFNIVAGTINLRCKCGAHLRYVEKNINL